jgi:ubiquinone/menaquinone biosynthesis C-methylase UbiE
MAGERGSRYLPALRFQALTRLYDPVVRLTSREGRFKEMLVDQAAAAAGQRILDLGCGTGTLALQVKQREPGAQLVGLDADPEMLAQARRKAEQAGVELELTEGFSTELPYEDASFDRVLSTLFFHHLDPEPKRQTAREIARVLKKRGELHVADWGRPSDPVMAAAFLGIRLLDGFENTADNVRGELPAIFEKAGLRRAEQTDRLRTVLGTLALYRAERAD